MESNTATITRCAPLAKSNQKPPPILKVKTGLRAGGSYAPPRSISVAPGEPGETVQLVCQLM